jgi:hypothetical protein
MFQLAGGIRRAGTFQLAGGIRRAGTLAATLVGPALMFDSRELGLYGLTVMNAASQQSLRGQCPQARCGRFRSILLDLLDKGNLSESSKIICSIFWKRVGG